MTLPQRILAAVDFSDQSQAVIDQACDLARHSKAQLHLINVDPSLNGQASEEVKNAALEQLAQLIQPDDELNVETTKVIRGGPPHRAIVEYAKAQDIDLIVMGTRGRTGLSHLALGSVAERVMRHSACPVQVIKQKPLEDNRFDLAMETLVEEFGDSLSGKLAQTENRICHKLETTLGITAANAAQLFEQLQHHDWATWTPDEGSETQGTWRFMTGIEFLEDTNGFEPTASNSPATELVVRVRKLRATDIHIDPSSTDQCRVRLRIDGQLEEFCRLDHSVAEHLINQWKLMAGLDVAEPFRPKEGRVAFPDNVQELADVEARFTSAPVAGGEAVAMRLFTRSDLYIPLTMLGLSDRALAEVDAMLRDAEGLVLVSGPTGSGKTTTVYSMLESISSSNRNIVSIEDPVEFPVPFVRQMSVNERHGVSMTQGLKTLLRMDPDIIFLGEIRDSGAADIAMQAAASGRYVFSTLHTRDVAAVFTTLRDFRLADGSLAANIAGVVNQRLMRRLCTHCRQEIPVTDELKRQCESRGLDVPKQQCHRVGCARCRGTGYFGRTGVFEAVSLTPDLREAIGRGDTESQLRTMLAAGGLNSLGIEALAKVADGVTDADELSRVHWV